MASETEHFAGIFGEPTPPGPAPAASPATPTGPAATPASATSASATCASAPSGPAASATRSGSAAGGDKTADRTAEPAAAVPDTDAPAGDVFARRRRNWTRAAVAAACVGALVAWHCASAASLGSRAKTAAATAAPTPSKASAAQAAAQLTAALADAHRWAAAHGTYRGWRPSLPGVAAATGDNAAVVTYRFDGDCWYSGIIPGQPTRVLTDPAACAPGALTQVQSSLDSNDAATAATVTATLTSALSGAAAQATWWASRHVTASGPSFAGLPAVAGVKAALVAGGSAVVLSATDASSCLAETVHASGAATAPGPC